jgi:hypothetical protein
MQPTLRLVLLVMSAAAAWAVPVAQAAEPALDGTYIAQGFNPDGSEYRGVVKITPRGEGFLIAWFFPHLAGEEIVLVFKSGGVALRSGGTLAVSYYGQDATGIALYEIENGGQRLVGRWASANGEGAVQTETLTRLPAPTAAPDTGAPVRRVQKEPIRASAERAVVPRR